MEVKPWWEWESNLSSAMVLISQLHSPCGLSIRKGHFHRKNPIGTLQLLNLIALFIQSHIPSSQPSSPLNVLYWTLVPVPSFLTWCWSKHQDTELCCLIQYKDEHVLKDQEILVLQSNCIAIPPANHLCLKDLYVWLQNFFWLTNSVFFLCCKIR